MRTPRPTLKYLTSLFSASSSLCVRLSAATTIALLAGCAPSATTFTNLSGHGIVPVSSDNPYMGANIFLAKEMEESNYLYKFMKEKGAPQAIELTGTSEENASMRLFYSGNQEVYTASPQIDPTLRSREWIIRGPYSIERVDYREVSQLDGRAGGIFEIFGRREVLGGPVIAAESRVIAPAFIEPTQPKRRVSQRKKVAAKQSSGSAPAGFTGAPTNFDQQALAEARQGTPAVANGSKTPSAPVKAPAAPSGPAITIERISPVVIPGEKVAATPTAHHK